MSSRWRLTKAETLLFHLCIQFSNISNMEEGRKVQHNQGKLHREEKKAGGKCVEPQHLDAKLTAQHVILLVQTCPWHQNWFPSMLSYDTHCFSDWLLH